MPETKEVKMRSLGEKDCPDLYAARDRVNQLEGEVRSAESNLRYFSQFLDEAKAHIESNPPAPVKADWESRLKACRDEQIPEEKRKKGVSEKLLVDARKTLDAEKAKVKGLVDRGGDFLVPE